MENLTIERKEIKTNVGEIVVYSKAVENTIPIIFLHGVYYDHNLWNYFINRISNHTTISIDMPSHGQSKNITKKNWTMEDCSKMLLEIIDYLGYSKVFAIGHSWGSMTILRAATTKPEKFKTIGLCNMPFEEGSFSKQLTFGFQHMVLPFRNFYVKQAAKAMLAEASRKSNPEIVEYLKTSMALLSNKEVKQTDKAVITTVDDGKNYLNKLKTPALALKGNQDYVGTLENIETIIVESGHTSPLEQPEEVLEMIINLTTKLKE